MSDSAPEREREIEREKEQGREGRQDIEDREDKREMMRKRRDHDEVMQPGIARKLKILSHSM